MNVPIDIRRGRRQLLLIVAVFFAPMLLAAILALSGWVPSARSHGQPIVPQESFAGLKVSLADGKIWPWKAATPQYTLMALVGSGCAAACLYKLYMLHNAQIGLNESSKNLRLLYVGAAPVVTDTHGALQSWVLGQTQAAALLRFLPQQADQVAVILAAADGTAVVYYPPTVSVIDINKDLRRLFK